MNDDLPSTSGGVGRPRNPPKPKTQSPSVYWSEGMVKRMMRWREDNEERFQSDSNPTVPRPTEIQLWAECAEVVNCACSEAHRNLTAEKVRDKYGALRRDYRAAVVKVTAMVKATGGPGGKYVQTLMKEQFKLFEACHDQFSKDPAILPPSDTVAEAGVPACTAEKIVARSLRAVYPEEDDIGVVQSTTTGSAQQSSPTSAASSSAASSSAPATPSEKSPSSPIGVAANGKSFEPGGIVRRRKRADQDDGETGSLLAEVQRETLALLKSFAPKDEEITPSVSKRLCQLEESQVEIRRSQQEMKDTQQAMKDTLDQILQALSKKKK